MELHPYFRQKSQKQRTGPKSLTAFRAYECTSNCQLLDVSNIASNFFDMNETSPVSVKSTVSICMPLSTVEESSRCTAMVGPHVPTPLSQSMARKKGPSVLLSGCNFSNCTISSSGNPVASCEKENRSSPGEVDTTELLQGISVDELLSKYFRSFLVMY